MENEQNPEHNADFQRRLERLEHEHEEIAKALRVLDEALGGALALLKSHHGVLKKAIDGEADIKVTRRPTTLN